MLWFCLLCQSGIHHQTTFLYLLVPWCPAPLQLQLHLSHNSIDPFSKCNMI
jgi:hypothetical protein